MALAALQHLAAKRVDAGFGDARVELHPVEAHTAAGENPSGVGLRGGEAGGGEQVDDGDGAVGRQRVRGEIIGDQLAAAKAPIEVLGGIAGRPGASSATASRTPI